MKTELAPARGEVKCSSELKSLRATLLLSEDVHRDTVEESTCLDGTRALLRENIMKWVSGEAPDIPALCWLRGQTGSGKSTVANTIAFEAQRRGHSISYFSCRIDDVNLSNPRRVLPTLAYRFAQQHEKYRSTICKLSSTDIHGPSITTVMQINSQFNSLFARRRQLQKDPPTSLVVIVDALDECGSPMEQAHLARCFLQLSRLEAGIKIFVTSQDRPVIRRVFSDEVCIQRELSANDKTNDDIQRYIRTKAQDMGVQLSFEEVEQLAKRAAGLFIWCSTLFEWLSSFAVTSRRQGLEIILASPRREGPCGELDGLYDEILRSTVKNNDQALMRAVLSVVNVAARNRPLSVRTITKFLDIKEPHGDPSELRVHSILQQLHVVLYEDQSIGGGFRAYHSSFYDFLERKASQGSAGWERLKMTHTRVLRRCLDILHAQLRFNVCDIRIPVLNKDIPDLAERISRNISEELQYSSCFWFTHLLPSGTSPSDIAPTVSRLLCSWKLLFWLETLSLQGASSQSLPAFTAIMNFFHVSLSRFIVVMAANPRAAIFEYRGGSQRCSQNGPRVPRGYGQCSACIPILAALASEREPDVPKPEAVRIDTSSGGQA